MSLNYKPAFPSFRMRLFLIGYRVLWFVLMPVVLLYLFWRGRRDTLYRQHIGERFGHHKARPVPHVWVHAVSLGELRSAVPLIDVLLERGEHVVITHFTPAGRREAQKTYGPEISEGRVTSCYVPFDYDGAFVRFFKSFRPKYGLVMEVEFWPGMIASAQRHDVPLLLCNGQYPSKSFIRDSRQMALRTELVGGFAGVMVKSKLQADRFEHLGATNTAITGEMRFEQTIPPEHIVAGTKARSWLSKNRPVVTLASVVEGEDNIYINAIIRAKKAYHSAGLPTPVYVYVPRAPERFEETYELLCAAGLRVKKRSDLFDTSRDSIGQAPEIDVLLGNSMGEMYFYISLSDQVIVGGGFVPKGAHNIIEPLSLSKAVLVGPHVWTIEYPVVEAQTAGVTHILPDADALVRCLSPEGFIVPSEAKIDAFLEEHAGAVNRTLAAIPILIATSAS